MDKKGENYFLKKCKQDIIKKYIGNDLLKFTHADFERLSEDIFESTKISISVSTLKRIWKSDYKKSPNVSTLDAFANYLGFKNWKEYCSECLNQQVPKGAKIEPHDRKNSKKYFFIAIPFVVAIVLFVLHPQILIKQNYNDVEFTIIEFDSTQMPATAIFKYNLNGIKSDSITIRPLGTNEAEFSISVNDTIASYTYIRPWQYLPTLAIDGKPVESLKVNFVSGKWQTGLSNTHNVYFIKYFNDAEILTGGTMNFSKDFLEQKNFPVNDIDYTTFDLFKRFNNIYGDSINFETRIKNTLLKREENAGKINIALCFNKDYILFPLSIEKSPYAPLSATFFDRYISGKNSNISFMYQDVEDWITLRLKTNEKLLSLYVNDSLAFKTNYGTNPGKLMGVMFDFYGLGSVDYVRFYKPNGELIENYEFD